MCTTMHRQESSRLLPKKASNYFKGNASQLVIRHARENTNSGDWENVRASISSTTNKPVDSDSYLNKSLRL